MFSRDKPALWAAIAALGMGMASSALAQEAQGAHDRQDSNAGPPPSSGACGPPSYQSAFESYHRYGDETPLPWRQANDTVGAIGGWKSYAREAQGAGEPASAPPAAATGTDSTSSPAPAPTPPATIPSSGHGSHGVHKPQ
jgi:hypothetical protein